LLKYLRTGDFSEHMDSTVGFCVGGCVEGSINRHFSAFA